MRVIAALSIMLGTLCSFTTTIEETQKNQLVINITDEYPTAFVIREDPTAFEALNEVYHTLLLTACENNMDKAYKEWQRVLFSLNIFAKQNDVDLQGVKMWIKIFWSKDGYVKHIAYDLKPQSKQIKKKELTKLIEEFILSYQEPVTSYDYQFSHYGSVAYPFNETAIHAD